jgi:hypothetical protein
MENSKNKDKYYINQNLSYNADLIINKFFLDKKIILVCEDLSDDLYDKYGTNTDIWNLYILVLEDEYMIYHYHWETILCRRKKTKSDSYYQLEKSLKLSDTFGYIFFHLHEYVKLTDNEELKNAFLMKI